MSSLVNGQLLVVTSDGLQGGIHSRLTLFLFVVVGSGSFRIFRAVRIFRELLALLSRNLQGRVVVHFGLDAFQQLGDRQLSQLCLQQLLLRDALCQLLLLGKLLLLYLFLCHRVYSQ